MEEIHDPWRRSVEDIRGGDPWRRFVEDIRGAGIEDFWVKQGSASSDQKDGSR